MKIFASIFLSLFFIHLHSQSLNARIEYPFIDGENEGIYSGGIVIKSGVIKVGDIITMYDDGNNTSQMKIKELKDYDATDNENVNSLSSGKSGFIVLQTLDKKKLPSIKGGFSLGTKPNLEDASNPYAKVNNPIVTTCNLNGKEWKGKSYYKSASYFPNGNTLLKTTKPYVLISIKSGLENDDRLITFSIPDYKGGMGIVNKDAYEFVFSGKENGNECILSNWVKGEANTHRAPFHFEFTKWEDKGSYILVSAKYHGKLNALNLLSGLIGKTCDDLVVSEGVIFDLKLEKN
jgi:hypothetical protein